MLFLLLSTEYRILLKTFAELHKVNPSTLPNKHTLTDYTWDRRLMIAQKFYNQGNNVVICQTNRGRDTYEDLNSTRSS